MAWQAVGSARPSKAMSWLSAAVGLGMVVTVATFFWSPIYGIMAFVALWIFVVLGIVGYHLMNATSPGGVAHSTFSFRSQPTSPAAPARQRDFDDRLRDLHKLRADGLITEDEYNRKRADILNEDW